MNWRAVVPDHLLKGDLFLLALSALAFLRWLLSARSVGSAFDVGNLPTLFQLVAHIADSVVADLGLLGDLSIALGWIGLQQCCDYLASLVGAKVAAMNVGADDVIARSSIIANEVCELGHNLNKLASTIAIVAIEDFAVLAHDLMQAIKLDVSGKLTEVVI
jgi:hypothetical protein